MEIDITYPVWIAALVGTTLFVREYFKLGKRWSRNDARKYKRVATLLMDSITYKEEKTRKKLLGWYTPIYSLCVHANFLEIAGTDIRDSTRKMLRETHDLIRLCSGNPEQIHYWPSENLVQRQRYLNKVIAECDKILESWW